MRMRSPRRRREGMVGWRDDGRSDRETRWSNEKGEWCREEIMEGGSEGKR